MSLFIYFFITFHISPPLLIPRGRKGNERIKKQTERKNKIFFFFSVFLVYRYRACYQNVSFLSSLCGGE